MSPILLTLGHEDGQNIAFGSSRPSETNQMSAHKKHATRTGHILLQIESLRKDPNGNNVELFH